jgi:hypothetical protein
MSTKPVGFPKEIAWNTLDTKEQALFSSLYGKINTLERQSSERKSGVGVNRDENAILNIQDSIENFDQDLLNQIEKSLENMTRSGAFFAREAGFTRGLQQASKEMMLLFGSAERAANAFQFLTTNMRGFGKIRDVVTETGKALTGALALQQAAFEQAGMSASTFKDNVDMMVYSFGLNAQEVQSFNFQIRDLAKDLDMMPEQVSRNFQLVAKNLSYDIGSVTDQFARMQKLSIQTGVDVGTIGTQFGTGMDTISGASSSAANINALLGRNAFSATELLMMDEATRAEQIREAVMNDPRLKASLSKGGPEAKFALDTIKDILGMSREDAKKFITTGKLKDAEKPIDPTKAEASLKSKIAQEVDMSVTQSVIKNFSTTVKTVDKEFRKLVKDIKIAQLSHTERENLEFRRRRLTPPPAARDSETLGTQLRGQARSRAVATGLSGEYDERTQLRLTQIPSYGRVLRELEEQRESGLIKEGAFDKQIANLKANAGSAADADKAADSVRTFLESKTSEEAETSRTQEGRAGLDKVSLAQIQSISTLKIGGERGLRQLRRFFRENKDPANREKYIKTIEAEVEKLNRLLKTTGPKRASPEDLRKQRNRVQNARLGKTGPDLDNEPPQASIPREVNSPTPSPAGSTSTTSEQGPVPDPALEKKVEEIKMPGLSNEQRDRARKLLNDNALHPDRGAPRTDTNTKSNTQAITQILTLDGKTIANIKSALQDGVLTLKEFKTIFNE